MWLNPSLSNLSARFLTQFVESIEEMRNRINYCPSLRSLIPFQTASVPFRHYSIFLEGTPVKLIKYSKTNENEIVSRFIEFLNGIPFAI